MLDINKFKKLGYVFGNGQLYKKSVFCLLQQKLTKKTLIELKRVKLKKKNSNIPDLILVVSVVVNADGMLGVFVICSLSKNE